jgi:hypothetical protein
MVAYAYGGGPFMMMTWDNGDYRQTEMQCVCAHEFSHLFWALDEYMGSETCEETTGYLNVENGNMEDSCATDERCLMRSFNDMVPGFRDTLYCHYSREQVGWRDTDGDSILDVMDTEALVTLVPPADPSASNFLDYAGWAVEEPLTNQNPFGTGESVSLNEVVAVEYRVDGSEWLPAAAADSAWDSGSEPFSFSTWALANGEHVIEVRSVNSVGNVSVAADTITVDANPVVSVSEAAPPPAPTGLVSARPNPFNPETWITYELGSAAGVRVEVIDLTGARVRVLTEGTRTAGRYEVRWDGSDQGGRPAASGVYFVRLLADGESDVRKLTLLR